MVFSSIEFLCIFLPLALLLYYSCPKKARNALLFAISLIFYAYGEWRYLFIMLFSTFFDFGNGLMLERFERSGRVWAKKLVLILSLTVNLGLLAFFKYTDFVLENLNTVPGISLSLLHIALPLGISFYTFQTLSYTIDVYRGRVKAQHSLISFGMYITMFPQLIAGPIVRYSDISGELDCRQAVPREIAEGIERFVIGLAKKVLLANLAGELWKEISGSSLTVTAAWIGAVAYAMHIYFDFSGYSDMAIGLGKMFGFHFPENFRYPYSCVSVTDFWHRWHITLSTWFREYLYIPLGGNRKGTARQIFNLFIVWSLTGLWHGAGWNFLLWGLYYFVLLACEKLFLLRLLQRLPKVIQHLAAMLAVLVGWIIFALETPQAIITYLLAMVGGAPLTSGMSGYYLLSYGLPLCVMVIGCTPLPQRLKSGICAQLPQGACFSMRVVCGAVLLAVSLILVVSSGYNPFLYFRF